MEEIYRKEKQEIMDLNLKVLRNMDPEISEILIIASFCSLHELDKASKIWHACEMAGPLFLVKRGPKNSLKMILLNQKNTIDYEEEIYAGQKFELKESEKFLFFQNRNSVIKGIWISNAEDLKKIYSIINEYVSTK
jgi:Dcp1-like decapping family.